MLASPATSLLSPFVHSRGVDDTDPSAAGISTSAFRTAIAAGDQVASLAAGDEGNSGRIARAARHMIRHALHDFRHELKDTLRDLGFNRDEIADVVRGVMDPVRAGLKSGQSFSAQVMVAAATQVSFQGNGIQGQSFNLAVDALDIQYNHETGEVTVSTVSLDVEARSIAFGGAAAPQLFDINDGAPSLPNLGDILDAVGDLFDIALPATDDEETRSAPVAAALPADAAVPRTSDRVQLTEPAAPPADAKTETTTPAVPTDEAAAEEAPTSEPAPAQKTRAFARINVDIFEQFVNANGQLVSHVRLGAKVPLDLNAADVPVPALPVDGTTVSPDAGTATGSISIQA